MNKELGLELSELQRNLHEQKKGVLIIFEGLDSSGKGTSINKVLQFLDPRGYKVYSNENKTKNEKLRPFMWKYFLQFPKKGEIVVLDRSYYYELLIKSYKGKLKSKDYSEYLDIIDETEKTLVDEGIVIIKLFLHVDKKTQFKRLQALDKNPYTTWRVNKKEFEKNKNYKIIDGIYKKLINSCTLPFFEVNTTEKNYLDLIFTHINKQLKSFKSPFDPLKNEINDLTFDWEKYNVPYEIEELEYKKLLLKYQNKLRELQHVLYEKRKALVVVFEGIDAAGKGGTIKRFVEGLDPRGYDVIPVSAPNSEEKEHHYLWRFWKGFPKAGHIAVFDRSWYGRLLVERAENFCSEEAYFRAFQEIKQMERAWVYDGAIVVKFFITISKEEQLLRFEDRKTNKPWKITEEDWRNREKWDLYETLASSMIEETSTTKAPWIVIPNNNKYFGRIEVLKSLIEVLSDNI